MMGKVVCFLALVALASIQNVESAPRHKSIGDMSESELSAKFEEFLHQDKEMRSVLDSLKSEGHSVFKRQASTQELEDDFEDATPKTEDGFLDRAAKFVMEIVQRFLKWINTD